MDEDFNKIQIRKNGAVC